MLALPELYGRFNTTIEGVAWVVTAYNVAVAVTALALVFLVHRVDAARVLGAGLIVFLGASIACASAGSLSFLIGARCVQGVGAALLLAGSLPVLAALTGSSAKGAGLWTLAGTFGLALGPALGGVLTQAFDWRAIFVAQAPVAALGLLATVRAHPHAVVQEGWRPSLQRSLPANLCLGLLFGALVGALFLAVLLVITVWGYSPIGGAALVSVAPGRRPGRPAAGAAAAACRRGLGRCRPARRWPGRPGLAARRQTSCFAVWALALCGAGLGLAVPLLSQAALDLHAGLARSGTLTVGVRHLGLVLALASIAPLLASEVPNTGDKALLKATAVLLDSPAGLDKKVPVALDLRGAFAKAREGETPDLSEPFNKHGARTDSALAETRDKLVGTIEATITRAFRPAFLLSAAFAALALAAAVLFRRRLLS